VTGLGDGQVHHQPVGRRAVPVLLVGLEQHAVAGPDDRDRAAAAASWAATDAQQPGIAAETA
jgi:hypothetical protein